MQGTWLERSLESAPSTAGQDGGMAQDEADTDAANCDGSHWPELRESPRMCLRWSVAAWTGLKETDLGVDRSSEVGWEGHQTPQGLLETPETPAFLCQ